MPTIDKAGDGEEEKVFQRTEEEFEHIVQLLRKIAGIKGNNVIITSDHGYLYQLDPVAESDFANFKVAGEILKQTRRFLPISSFPRRVLSATCFAVASPGLRPAMPQRYGNCQRYTAASRLRSSGRATTGCPMVFRWLIY
ncbi:MAG: PglZ domain-containing protein [Lewinellaceae bacterium]|nr:PglZ domain-containing protein [Lewinellaceae bacterium]